MSALRRSAGPLSALVMTLTAAGSAFAAAPPTAAAAPAAAPAAAAQKPAPAAEAAPVAPVTPVAAAPAPEPAAAPVPLQLRPEHQTAFTSPSAPAASSSSLPSWILGILGLGGLGFVMFKKKQDQQKASRPTPVLKVRARASMGARSSVVVVDIDGQSLVLGITPSSINLLTTLESADAEASSDEGDADEDAAPARLRTEATKSAPKLASPIVDPRERLSALLNHPSLAPAPAAAKRTSIVVQDEPETEIEAAPSTTKPASRPRRRTASPETQAAGLVRAKKLA